MAQQGNKCVCDQSMWPEFDPQRSLTEKPGKVLCPFNLTLVETERYLEFSGGPAPLNWGVPGPDGRSWLKKQSEAGELSQLEKYLPHKLRT